MLPDHLTWRPPTLDDLEALAAHLKRVDAAENLDFVPGIETWSWLLGQPDIDLQRDLIVGVDDQGQIVADAGSWFSSTQQGSRAWVWFDADPKHDGVKPALARWAHGRASQQLTKAEPGVPRFIRIPVEEHRESHRSHIEALGLEPARSFVEMRRSLEELPEPRTTPSGLRVILWDDAMNEAVRLASNSSFADHWGSLPMNAEQWQAMFADSGTFRRDLSFLAVTETNDVASMSLCEVDAEDDPNLLWVNRVGTIPAARRLGLATILISRSMQAAAAASLSEAGLDVDETSHTDATKVYERLGYAFTKRSIHYIEDLDPR